MTLQPHSQQQIKQLHETADIHTDQSIVKINFFFLQHTTVKQITCMASHSHHSVQTELNLMVSARGKQM